MSEKTIGRYIVESELGRGGMATVYLATDPRFRRQVAIKVLPREFLHEPTFRARFDREAQTIATLEHPAILPVYDFGEDDGQPFIVMRYLSGGSLADVLQQRRLTPDEIAHLYERISAALDEAHSRGVIHRDLKPGNIMYDQRGEPYLSDFGIAKLQEAAGGTLTGGGVVGTPAYMSPEQAKGNREIDGRSDVYALGAILYQLLTGDMPYKADTPIGLVVKHITDPVPSLKDAAPNVAIFDPIIQTAMAKNPDDRYSSAGELAAAIREVIGGSKATAPTAWVTNAPAAPTHLPPTPAPASAAMAGTVMEDSAPDSFAGTRVEESAPVAPAPVVATRVDTGTSAPAKPGLTPPAAAAPAKKSGGLPLLWIIGGGIGLFVVVGLIALIGGGAFFAAQISGGNQPTATEPVAVSTPDTTEVAVVIEQTQAAAAAETEAAQPTATDEPTATPTVTATPTATPTPDIDFVDITRIDLINNTYSVTFTTYNYTPALPSKHIHFFYNTVPPDQAGVPGVGPWQIYGGSSPFTLFNTSNRPNGATQICALVANPEHTVQPNSGNCWNIP